MSNSNRSIELCQNNQPTKMNQTYDLVLSIQEGYNGCNKRIMKENKIYQINIPKYTIHTTCITVDDILFVTAKPLPTIPLYYVELPDCSYHKISTKHMIS